MDKVDVVIIGAGVVGLAIAKQISEARSNYSVIVVEREDSFGRQTSSRNSEVIHGGMYYPQGSLKAKFCVEGRRLLYDICQKHGIACKKTGKLIIATQDDERPELDKLFFQGEENGVEGLKMLTAEEMVSREPELKGVAALLSSETGIIDSHRLMEYFLQASKDRGVMVAFDSEVVGFEKVPDGYRLRIKNGNEVTEIETSVVINSAGLDADRVAHMAGLDIEKLGYQLHYNKGQYFRLASSKARRVSTLAYPVPKPKGAGLGIHATLDLAGGMRLGPDDAYLSHRNKDYSVDSSKRHDFYLSVSRFMPFVEESDLTSDISGIRPKLQEPGGVFRDFVAQEETDHGFPGFINLIGIESPGLTASCALARHVATLVR